MVTWHAIDLRSERGKLRWGCLLWIVVLGAVVYLGYPVGVEAFKYYRMSDAMKGQARFASAVTDAEIQRRLVAKVDSLGLPSEAKKFTIRRTGRPPEIRISTSWSVTFEFPFYAYTYTFKPEARARL
jgi:hypothetical protein